MFVESITNEGAVTYTMGTSGWDKGKSSLDHDIAILRIPAEQRTPHVGMPLPQASHAPHEGSRVVTCGWPLQSPSEAW